VLSAREGFKFRMLYADLILALSKFKFLPLYEFNLCLFFFLLIKSRFFKTKSVISNETLTLRRQEYIF